MKINNYIILALSFFASYFVYLLLHGFEYYYYAAAVAVFSALILLTYNMRRYYFYGVVSATLLSVFLLPIPVKYSVGIIAVNIVLQSILIRELSAKRGSLSVKTELRRDIVQIMLGSVFLVLLYYFSNMRLQLFLIFIGLFAAHVILVYGGKLRRFVVLLEREGVVFGSGAVFLACGSLFLLAFVNRSSFLFFGLFSLLISDPLATISGLISGNTLGRKSITGTAVFFASALIPAVYFFGFEGAVFSLILALAERFSPIDDNLFIAFSAAVLSFLVFV